MPEGDAVWRTARRLEKGLSGQVLTGSDFRVPQLATVDLAGADVLETVPYGKHLLTRVHTEAAGRAGREWTIHTHLRMEGSWRVLKPGQRWSRPGHQARLILTTDQVQAVGFSLGIVELVPTDRESTIIGHLGPDVLGADWDVTEAVERLRAQPQRSVFAALLDQRNLAGLGTMWAAELCFRAKIHPTRAAGEVDLGALIEPAPALMDPEKFRRPHLRVFGHRACTRCGTSIRVLKIGPAGRQRDAHHCPTCQSTD